MMFVIISVILTSLTLNVTAQDKIVFADAGWGSIRFHNEVARVIIEKGYEYPTSVISGSTATTFLGLEQGDIDAYMEVWTNDLGEIYYPALEEGTISQVSVNYNDNSQGLYVPTYVIEGDQERNIQPQAPDLKTVKDLEKYWELFQDEENPSKGRIYGSPPGWTIDRILRTKIKSYGLDQYFNCFSPGSTTALSAAIVGAYEKGEPIVAYFWEPSWVIGMLDMTLLEEPPYSDKKWHEAETFDCAFKKMDIAIAVNQELPERVPEVVKFLSHYHTSSNMTSKALSYMRENEVDAREAALWFLRNREDVWTQWIPEKITKKIKTAI